MCLLTQPALRLSDSMVGCDLLGIPSPCAAIS
jgi:hypothetical protein